MTPDEAFEALTGELQAQGAERAQMMGRPMFQVDGRMFACLSNDRLALRLDRGSDDLAAALELPGATLFSPGADRVWRDWVSLPLTSVDEWPDFAARALQRRIA